MDHRKGGYRDAAESVAESLSAIVEAVLTSQHLTDEQWRDVLSRTRDFLGAEGDVTTG